MLSIMWSEAQIAWFRDFTQLVGEIDGEILSLLDGTSTDKEYVEDVKQLEGYEKIQISCYRISDTPGELQDRWEKLCKQRSNDPELSLVAMTALDTFAILRSPRLNLLHKAKGYLRKIDLPLQHDNDSDFLMMVTHAICFPHSFNKLELHVDFNDDTPFAKSLHSIIVKWFLHLKQDLGEFEAYWPLTDLQKQHNTVQLLVDLGVTPETSGDIFKKLQALHDEQSQTLLAISSALREQMSASRIKKLSVGMSKSFSSELSLLDDEICSEVLKETLANLLNQKAVTPESAIKKYRQFVYKELLKPHVRKMQENIQNDQVLEIQTVYAAFNKMPQQEIKNNWIAREHQDRSVAQRLAFGREQRSLSSKLKYSSSYLLGVAAMAAGVLLVLGGIGALPFFGAGSALILPGILLFSIGVTWCAATGVKHAYSDYTTTAPVTDFKPPEAVSKRQDSNIKPSLKIAPQPTPTRPRSFSQGEKPAPIQPISASSNGLFAGTKRERERSHSEIVPVVQPPSLHY
ncbi:MAG: hypothetical protein A3F10_05970 [Coxiella sp. RIFCSPHIGHO2_12_FULL_42_15]|nr:MAG: hypothetical protein A3F10_05970 [Coxiella sp. RIFCSPHIGHO2_12_FULL_42_15]